MKRYFLIWLIGWMLLGTTVLAQQIPLSSLFMENPFVFNPAVAGSENSFKVRLNNRTQWLGFDDAPVTTQLSAYGPHKVRNIGYGGNISYDSSGPTSMLRMNGAFATNFAVDFDMRISLGLNLGLIQFRADGTQLRLIDQDDPYANAGVMSNFRPDGGAGVYVYHYDFYGGLSVQQLFNNNLSFVETGMEDKRNRLKTHFYGLAGYKFAEVSLRWIVEPSVLIRKVAGNPAQMDLSTRVTYNQMLWGGLFVRNTFESFNDLSLILGYIHDKKIAISIAYDFSFADIRKYTHGSIEFMLGYNFDAFKPGR